MDLTNIEGSNALNVSQCLLKSHLNCLVILIFTFIGILYSTLQRCEKFGNVTVKNYLNESCCLFCAPLFTVKVPSRKGFDVNCQKFI